MKQKQFSNKSFGEVPKTPRPLKDNFATKHPVVRIPKVIMQNKQIYIA